MMLQIVTNTDGMCKMYLYFHYPKSELYMLVFIIAFPKERVVFVGVYICISQEVSELTRRGEEVCICWSTRKDLCTGLLFILLYCIVYFLCNVHLIIQLQIGAWLYNYLESQPSRRLPYLVFVLFFKVVVFIFVWSCVGFILPPVVGALGCYTRRWAGCHTRENRDWIFFVYFWSKMK